MSIINISNLTFAYDGSYDNIFENVSFCLDTDWRLGFTGRNGRGKTTFLNLLLGKYSYQGTITSSVSFEYFPYNIPDKNVSTIEAAYGYCPSIEYWELCRELNLLEISEEILNRPFNTLSSGEQTKLLLAVMFLKENSFLLIDEPTNHLDINARKILGNYLKRKSGFILVSHDRNLLDTCTDHILSVNRTNIEIQKGNFSVWQENKERRDSYEIAENNKLKKEVSRLGKTAKEKAAWSDSAEKRKIGFDPNKTEKSASRRSYEGAKSKKMMKRAKVIEERRQTTIDEKSKLLKNIESAEQLKIIQIPFHTARLVSLEDVSVFYGETAVCEKINFTVEQGDCVSLTGKNGSGKSSIIKLICGEDITYTGNFQKGSRLVISYVSQDTSFLSGNLSGYALKNNIDESLFKAILRKLDFSRVQFDKNIEDFSEGQKKKVLIAKSLCEQAHLYIWDEPLNFIDVLSRIQIEQLIEEFKPTMLFVEHDKAFTDKIANKVIEL